MHPHAFLDCSEDDQQSSQSRDAEAASGASGDDESEGESQGGSSSSGGADDSNGEDSDADQDASLPPPPGIGHQPSDSNVISSPYGALISVLLSDTPCFGCVRSVSTACITLTATHTEDGHKMVTLTAAQRHGLCAGAIILA